MQGLARLTLLALTLVGCSVNVQTIKGLNETYHPVVKIIDINF